MEKSKCCKARVLSSGQCENCGGDGREDKITEEIRQERLEDIEHYGAYQDENGEWIV
jgi:hypothetical protein